MSHMKGLDGSGSLVSRVFCQNGWKHDSVGTMKERELVGIALDTELAISELVDASADCMSTHATPTIPLQWCKIGIGHIRSRQHPSSLPLTNGILHS